MTNHYEETYIFNTRFSILIHIFTLYALTSTLTSFPDKLVAALFTYIYLPTYLPEAVAERLASVLVDDVGSNLSLPPGIFS